jgi:CTP-dependent riboflavin kinase
VKIGHKVSDDYVQQVSNNEYVVRIYNTYTFNNKGSISWEYVFKNNKPTIYYPVGVVAIGRIVSGTGEFVNIKGYVKLLPTANGLRYVKIKYIK